MLIFVTLLLTTATPSSAFLWTLFGNHGCHCCRCPISSTPIPPSFSGIGTYSFSPEMEPITEMDLITSTSSYRGPPAAHPMSREQLQLEDHHTYATNQVAFNLDLRPVSVYEYGDRALSQLEDELAAEKYKLRKELNKKKEKEKEKEKLKKKQKQNRIKVFKIKPHKAVVQNAFMEWPMGMVAQYNNDKAVKNFKAAAESNNLDDGLEEFIPIEIGKEPALAAEEPAGPPPNVRNRISHDPILRHRKRFVTK